MSCECGKDIPFQECCGHFLEETQTPETAEELMRSRFVAFGLGNFDYIEKTQLEPLQEEVKNREAPEWERLEILNTEKGGPEDSEGTVEFIAYYHIPERRRHHELSRFVRVAGEWRYQDGDITDEAAPEPRTSRDWSP